MNKHTKLATATSGGLVGLWIAALIVSSLARADAALSLTNFTYTYNPGGNLPSTVTPYGGPYPDSTGTELNDNAPLTSSFGDPGWVGTITVNQPTLPTPEVDLTFDKEYNFSNLTITYLVDPNDGIPGPNHVDLSFSIDNVSYSTPQTFTGFDPRTSGPAAIETLTLDLTGHSGQFVKASFMQPASYTWVFLGEMDFTGTIPEPNTVLLAGLGGLLMWRSSRRG